MNNEDWDELISMIKENILNKLDKDSGKETTRDEIITWSQQWTVPTRANRGKGDLIAAIANYINLNPDRH